MRDFIISPPHFSPCFRACNALRILKGAFLVFALLLLSSARSMATGTRWQVVAPTSAPSGTTSYCQGAATGSYTSLAGEQSCTGTAAANVITWQWVYDGTTNIAGASGTFDINSVSPPTVTLTAAQSAVLSTLSPGVHTLQCKYTPAQTFCSGTAGVAMFSPALNITISAPGAVSVSGGGAACGSATLTASGGSGGTIYYQGATSNGTSTGTASSTASVSSSGTYYFRARTSGGCWGTQGSAGVTINPNAGAVTVTGAGTFCGNTTISASGGSGGTIYFQGTTSGGTSTTTPGTTASITSSGTYYFRARTAAGCWGTQGSATVTMNPPAGAVTVTGGGTYCDGAALSATGAPGDIIYFQGTTTGGTSTAVPSSLEAVLATGTYYFRAQTAAGCWGPEGSESVTINPAAGAVTVTGGGTYCDDAVLTASGGAGGTIYFEGSTSGGLSTAVPSTSESVTSSATYYFRARTAAGCWGAEGSASVTVNASPGGVTVTGGGTFCDNATITATGGGGGTVYFQGTTSGGTSTATASTSESVTASGTYYFRAQGSGGCWGPEGSVTVTINNSPGAVTVTGGGSYCEQATINATGGTGGTIYFQGTASGGTSTADPAMSATIVSSGTYYFRSQSATGCWGPEGSVAVTINPRPGAVSASGGGTFCTADAPLNATGGSGGTIYYQGTVSGGTSISVPSTTETVNATGTYYFRAQTPAGCWGDEAPVAITFNPLPTVADVTASANELCTGTPLTLSAGTVSGTGTLQSYDWAGPGGFSAATGSNTTILVPASVAASGDYSVTVTYSGTGCTSAVAVTSTPVVVNDLPQVADITTVSEICVGETLTLNAGTTSGTGTLLSYNWSGPNAFNATTSVNATLLLVSDVAESGSYSLSVTYQGVGCSSAAVVTSTPLLVNPLPDAIVGVSELCPGSSSTLSSATSSGVWTTSDGGVVSIDGGGTVTGEAAGTAIVTYTLPTTCKTTWNMTTNPTPADIAGATHVCVNSSTILTNADAGGNWSSADATVSVDGGTGTVSGIADGTAGITYTLPTGCLTTTAMTVDPLPANIDGPSEVCEEAAIALSNTDGGGTWSSTDATVIVNATSGEVEGVSEGTAIITYTLPTSCAVTKSVTVNGLPQAATGNTAVCEGESSTLSSIPAGGTWTSVDAGTVTVDPGGMVTGDHAGNATITYTIGTGCQRMTEFTVNTMPAAITGMTPVCEEYSTALANSVAGGAWSSDAANANISTSGVLTGVTSGNATISYTMPEGCYVTSVATVNETPAAITGAGAVCMEQSTILNTASASGVWSSSDDAIASVDASGEVSGVSDGTAVISYVFGTGCYNTRSIVVHPLPAAITGIAEVCNGLSTVLGSSPAGGAWTTGDAGIADIGMSAGSVIGIAPGTTNIVYTLPTGCARSIIVTVHALPAAIDGAAVACEGLGTALNNADGGGTWSSNASAIADVDAGGNVAALTAGTATITYTLPTTCISTVVYTVNPVPQPFSGSMQICEGVSHTLSNALVDGAWTSADDAVATITAGGLLSGVAAGTVDITYTLSTGCLRTEAATVNLAVPAITGVAVVCEGLTTTLANTAPGGIWTSGNTMAATADASSGIIGGVNAGTADITYTLPTGCATATTTTVNALPAAITGTASVCAGNATVLSTVSTDGAWSGGAAGIATIDATGSVSGIAAGTASFTYTLPTGCLRTHDIAVHPLPGVQLMSGGGNYCTGGAGVAIGLTSSSAATIYKLYRGSVLSGTQAGATGAVSFGLYTASGTYTVTATSSVTGCMNNMSGSASVTILPYVTPLVTMNSDRGDTVCGGTMTTFTATPVNGGSTPVYEWLVNDVPMGSGATYAYTPLHGDTIKVRLTSSEACPSPAVVLANRRMHVIANQLPTIAVEKISGDTACQYLPVFFHADATWAGNAPVYTWRKNGVDVATGPDYSYVPANGDVVLCRLTSNYRCRVATDVSSAAETLHVDSLYIPHVTVEVSPDIIVAPGKPAKLTAVVTDAGPSPVYEWIVNGTIVPGASANTYTKVFADNDVVVCKVYGTGACGMMSFNSVTMRVVNGAGIADAGALPGDIKLVPNPNNGDFAIQGTFQSDKEPVLEVINALGQVVYRNALALNNGTISAQVHLDESLPEGMYVLSVSSETRRAVMRFVIKR